MKLKLIYAAVWMVSFIGILASMALSPMQQAIATPTEAAVTPTATEPVGTATPRLPTPTRTPLPTYENVGDKPQASTWQNEPIMLSKPDQIGWFPEIFADAAGIVHLAWSSGMSTGPQRSYDVVLYRKTTNGVEWSDQLDIAAELTKGAVTRPAILVDSQGIFHLTYRSYTIFYLNFSAVDVKPKAPSHPYAISAGDIGYFSRLVKDSKGRLHVVFSENAFDINCEGCYHLYYRYSDDDGASWSDLVDITPSLNNGAAKPWILVDQDDNLHIVFEVGRGGDLGNVPPPARVSYLASYNRGENWTTPVDFVPNEDGEGRSITIGMDKQGNLISSWLALPEDLVYFKVSKDAGQTWSDPYAIPKIYGCWAVYHCQLDTYSMATDSAGNIHLVAVGRTEVNQTSLNVLELVWDGQNWSDPAIITTLEGDVPEWPRIAINKGNEVHVTWFVRKKSDIWTNALTNRVWYRYGKVAVLPQTPIPWPTLIPLPTLYSGKIEPSATPIQPLTSAIPQNINPVQNQPLVYSENGYLLVTGISILPVILVIGLVLIRVYWQRRRT